jgi:hypothetical protein
LLPEVPEILIDLTLFLFQLVEFLLHLFILFRILQSLLWLQLGRTRDFVAVRIVPCMSSQSQALSDNLGSSFRRILIP